MNFKSFLLINRIPFPLDINNKQTIQLVRNFSYFVQGAGPL